jgi:hypothetical protein
MDRTKDRKATQEHKKVSIRKGFERGTRMDSRFGFCRDMDRTCSFWVDCTGVDCTMAEDSEMTSV